MRWSSIMLKQHKPLGNLTQLNFDQNKNMFKHRIRAHPDAVRRLQVYCKVTTLVGAPHLYSELARLAAAHKPRCTQAWHCATATLSGWLPYYAPIRPSSPPMIEGTAATRTRTGDAAWLRGERPQLPPVPELTCVRTTDEKRLPAAAAAARKLVAVAETWSS